MTEWDYLDDYEREEYCYELNLMCQYDDELACRLCRKLGCCSDE